MSEQRSDVWVVWVSDGQEVTDVYAPLTEDQAKRLVAYHAMFIETLGVAVARKAKPMPPGVIG